ncbi:U7 snRNA-associated Sm-like protein LSm11 [Parasteatoda tepidariorum]|uniref:U7 snRNA-associated Sm-like protein LSm11 n=1 Tax=Parasteatoda tepidariorum TaxID=114398 RepID=UPI001C722605|nr:U7 snRNA-associated Sm-like protein LSm11 [Parasteatoda tepidariorum]
MHRSRRDDRPSRDYKGKRTATSSSSCSSSPPSDSSDQDLPQSFGKVFETTKDDDDENTNVLQRMSKKFVGTPLGALTKCLENRKIKVWTRNFEKVRGICTGYVVAFDKHWNLVMEDVDEAYFKKTKSKTPFLCNMRDGERFSEIPKNIPKKKTQGNAPSDDTGAKIDTVITAGKKKKILNKRKKGKEILAKRHIEKIFIKGDSIVMVAVMD